MYSMSCREHGSFHIIWVTCFVDDCQLVTETFWTCLKQLVWFINYQPFNTARQQKETYVLIINYIIYVLSIVTKFRLGVKHITEFKRFNRLKLRRFISKIQQYQELNESVIISFKNSWYNELFHRLLNSILRTVGYSLSIPVLHFLYLVVTREITQQFHKSAVTKFFFKICIYKLVIVWVCAFKSLMFFFLLT
jgi:hypothetical protein